MLGLAHSKIALKSRSLGQTSISLTEIGFGTAPLGNLYKEVGEDEASAALGAAWQSGIRYFDTAPYYGFGLSERRVGDITRNLEGLVLSTKVGRLLVPDQKHRGTALRHGFCSPLPFKPEFDYSYDAIMRSYETSLVRLGQAKIDILLVHDLGELTHGQEHQRHFRDFETGGYRALEELRSSGDIKAIGLGVNEYEICEQVMDVGQFDCFLLAGRYTLLEQGALMSFMPKCQAHGASLIIGGAYNSGILATGVRSSAKLHYNYETPPPEIVKQVASIEDICDAYKVPIAAAALQFPLHHELVTSVIPGVESAKRVKQTMALYETNIPSQLWADLKSEGLLHSEAPTP